ncbi:uncharacterized protein I303_104491 [Kwoniella dejecticola CBS 10117]|uniref:EGF-like domain-containing protein n=1 Tax=Kwoniella dejecticola CBS 10117 TaxID=1296121 RepID=A0A1A6A558_9TREE|nr:uncharacterized protein I303_04531 [Kwoniella dejecticola CBS 10117]OBR85199.1 hypothetical protein I303_04531 [Kwoniella dejecticola CBS 10117]
MTIIFSSTIAFALSTTYTWAHQVCSPETCLDGKAASPLLAHDPALSKYLTPGTYMDPSLDPSSSLLNIIKSSDSSTVSFPSSPIGFSGNEYSKSEDVWDNGNWSMDRWKSLYLPSTWFGVLENGKVVWGAIPDKGQLPNDLTGLKLSKAASAACDPPCSSHGVCLPSNITSGGTCQCSIGWTGASCDQCQSGYWGSSCSPGPQDCTIWDDGRSGTGACLGTKTSSLSSCNCDHGTCTSTTQCACSAGWITNGTVSPSLCNSCAAGFFGTSNGDCSACPLGCDNCTLQQGSNTTATCTSCSNNLTLSSGSPATCSTSSGSCADGTYFDETSSTCATCSPACSTCTGPSPSDCLSCASPRVNLQGSCVFYDATTGICDSGLSKLEGVYVVNLAKSRCDACPSGCLDCHIPSFTNTKEFESLQCSACREGYLLEDGKCVKKCDAGWYLPEGSAAKNGTCQKCDSTCSNCVTSSTTCTSCPAPLFASGGSCRTTCPESTIPLNGTCVPCPVDCATCSSPSTCSTCPPSRPVLSNGKCIEHCPQDQYFDSTHGCQACDWRCSSCSANDAKSCTSCSDGYKLSKGECVASACGDGGFASGLGICLSSLVTRSKKGYFGFFALAVLIVGAGVGAFYLYVRRERRKTREATKVFGDKLDDRAVQDNLRKLRLERVLGLERILISDTTDRGRGYEEKKNKRFRELLLPSRRRRTDVENDIEMKSTNFAPDRTDRSTYGYGAPPPPYAPSDLSPSPQDTKHPRNHNQNKNQTPLTARRDSLDSIPTPVLPTFNSSPIQRSFPDRPKSERKQSNGQSSTTIHSMSSPVSPEYASTSLMPPLRPGMSRQNTQEREKERKINRDRDATGEFEMERRLRDLWPNLRRKDEGWI